MEKISFLISLSLFIFAVLFYARIWKMGDQLRTLIELAIAGNHELEIITRVVREAATREEKGRPGVASKEATKARSADNVADPFDEAIAKEMQTRRLR